MRRSEQDVEVSSSSSELATLRKERDRLLQEIERHKSTEQQFLEQMDTLAKDNKALDIQAKHAFDTEKEHVKSLFLQFLRLLTDA